MPERVLPGWIGDDDPVALLAQLLPDYYLQRDARDGGLLSPLIDVLGPVFGTLRDEVAALYDDVFVDTAPPWLLPYLAGQLGVRNVPDTSAPRFNGRSWIGQVADLRRRRGTHDALVRACGAVSGFPVQVSWGGDAVATTKSLRDPAARPGRYVDVRDAGQGTASGLSASVSGHVPVGGDVFGEHCFPLPYVARIAASRVEAVSVVGVTPGAAEGGEVPPGRGFTFHPLGVDVPLYEPPRPRDRALSMPVAVTRAGLQRAAVLPFRLRLGRLGLTRDDVRAGDLSGWSSPPAPGGVVATVDPQLGRILLHDEPDQPLHVSYTYAAPPEVGAGPQSLTRPRCRPHASSVTLRADGTADCTTLDEALLRAVAHAALGCRIVIEDSATYRPVNRSWRATVPPEGRVTIETTAGAAPALSGALEVNLSRGARLSLTGLLMSGPVRVRGRGAADLACCTIVPSGRSSLTGSAGATVSVQSSVLGPAATTGTGPLAIRDSIVDAAGGDAIGSARRPVAQAAVERTTVIGKVSADALLLDECIVTGAPLHDRVEFLSTRYGNPAYARLASAGYETGGKDGRERGAFARFAESTRLQVLGQVAEAYLPAGATWVLEAKP